MAQKTELLDGDGFNEWDKTTHVKKKGESRGYFSDYEDHTDTELRPSLFWEYDMSQFNFQDMIRLVVQRVIERGGNADFYAMLNLYGWDRVVETIKILPYLGEKNINFASKLFNIPLKSLLCYKNMSSRERCWNY